MVYLGWQKKLLVVAAQLVEWPDPIPEVCSSNPVINQTLFFMSTAFKRRK